MWWERILPPPNVLGKWLLPLTACGLHLVAQLAIALGAFTLPLFGSSDAPGLGGLAGHPHRREAGAQEGGASRLGFRLGTRNPGASFELGDDPVVHLGGVSAGESSSGTTGGENAIELGDVHDELLWEVLARDWAVSVLCIY